MQSNQNLAISVPTFNRSSFLDEFLRLNIPVLKLHNIAIYISDNASTDKTKEVVRKWMNEYELLSYHLNLKNIGMDRNFEASLKLPSSQYIWLMGDTYIINECLLIRIINEIYNNKYDCILININNRASDIQEQTYEDCNRFLLDLGWHVTCLSCNIYKKTIIDNSNFARYYDTDLIHVGILFEYLSSRDFMVKWMPKSNIEILSNKSKVVNSWIKNTFEIWVIKWQNLIYSLPPEYKLDIKENCIINHGVKSKLFSFIGLLNLRANNILNIDTFLTYNNYFKKTINYNRVNIFFISVFPICILKLAKVLYFYRDKN